MKHAKTYKYFGENALKTLVEKSQGKRLLGSRRYDNIKMYFKTKFMCESVNWIQLVEISGSHDSVKLTDVSEVFIASIIRAICFYNRKSNISFL
jgi:hypothetical protein